ncbi:PaaD-like zinc ribbon domain-containing protein [Mycolicibacterium hippocampi]|uniref:PaaD-like zinc ribbon domain-containing protein n=1 Tax=Mycolicibacterium hippocampi TaxID=659824 RepID=UPI003F49577E
MPARTALLELLPASSSSSECCEVVRCRMCASLDTSQIAEHGSCSCKVLYLCRSCGEPFDHTRVPIDDGGAAARPTGVTQRSLGAIQLADCDRKP